MEGKQNFEEKRQSKTAFRYEIRQPVLVKEQKKFLTHKQEKLHQNIQAKREKSEPSKCSQKQKRMKKKQK